MNCSLTSLFPACWTTKTALEKKDIAYHSGVMLGTALSITLLVGAVLLVMAHHGIPLAGINSIATTLGVGTYAILGGAGVLVLVSALSIFLYLKQDHQKIDPDTEEYSPIIVFPETALPAEDEPPIRGIDSQALYTHCYSFSSLSLEGFLGKKFVVFETVSAQKIEYWVVHKENRFVYCDPTNPSHLTSLIAGVDPKQQPDERFYHMDDVKAHFSSLRQQLLQNTRDSVWQGEQTVGNDTCYGLGYRIAEGVKQAVLLIYFKDPKIRTALLEQLVKEAAS